MRDRVYVSFAFCLASPSFGFNYYQRGSRNFFCLFRANREEDGVVFRGIVEDAVPKFAVQASSSVRVQKVDKAGPLSPKTTQVVGGGPCRSKK